MKNCAIIWVQWMSFSGDKIVRCLLPLSLLNHACRCPCWPAPKAVLIESGGLRTAHAMCQGLRGHSSSLPCVSHLSRLSSSRKEISQLAQLNSSFSCINGLGDEGRRDCFVAQTPTSFFILVWPSRLRVKSKAWLSWWLRHQRGHQGVQHFCCCCSAVYLRNPLSPRESVILQVKC